jgi:hypothetical protein
MNQENTNDNRQVVIKPNRKRIANLAVLLKKAMLTLSITLLALSTITGSINAHARQQEQVNIELFNNPQAFLNVSFKDNVYLDNILDNELNSDKNWQGLKFDSNTFGITSLSGLSNIGGVEEMISINGQYNPRSTKKTYKNKLQELIVKIDDLKTNPTSINQITLSEGEGADRRERVSKETNTNDLTKEVSKELSKMNSWEVKKQRYFNFSQSKILNISIVGNTNTLDTIKAILDRSGHTKSLELTITSELQAKLEEVKKDIDTKLVSNNLPTQDKLKDQVENLSEEQKNKTLSIINSSTQELINTELSKTEEGKRQLQQTNTNQELINTGKVNLDDKDYQSIDKLLSTDKEGNKVIDNTLISNLEDQNYTTQEISIIKDLIKSYNDMPEYQKTNIQSSIQELEEKNGVTQSPITKATNLLSGTLSGVRAEAQWCKSESRLEAKWWGFRLWMNGCMVKNFNQYTNTTSIAMGIVAGYCGWVTAGTCSFIIGTLAALLNQVGSTLSWLSDQCNNAGAVIKKLYTGYFWLFKAC